MFWQINAHVKLSDWSGSLLPLVHAVVNDSDQPLPVIVVEMDRSAAKVDFTANEKTDYSEPFISAAHGKMARLHCTRAASTSAASSKVKRAR